MNKTLFSGPFLVCLLIAFSCGKEADNKPNASRSSSAQLITTQEGFKIKKVEKEKSESLASNNEETNHPPEITSIKIVYVSEDDPRDGFRAVVQAKDQDGDDISFRYQWKRNGEDIIGAVEEVLGWQEDFKKGDEIAVEVIPFDGKEEGVWKAEGEFMIPNSPPRIVSEPEAKMGGGKFSYTVKAEDPDGDPVEFTLKDAPKGMTIEPATGLITWNFDEKDAGEYKIEIIVSDTEGAKATQTLTLRIP